MYIQITTRCNMTCAHCGFACSKRGKDMTMDTWVRAVRLAREREDYITIGGGEPTLHPLFWQFLGFLFSCYTLHWPEDSYGVSIVTNGSRTDDAEALAGMARRGMIAASLSQDSYHDEIDSRVVRAFQKNSVPDNGDLRSIVTVRNITAFGRAKSWGNREGCFCEGLFVDPEGKLWTCGCREVRAGTVDAPKLPEDYDGYDHCCRNK